MLDGKPSLTRVAEYKPAHNIISSDASDADVTIRNVGPIGPRVKRRCGNTGDLQSGGNREAVAGGMLLAPSGAVSTSPDRPSADGRDLLRWEEISVHYRPISPSPTYFNVGREGGAAERVDVHIADFGPPGPAEEPECEVAFGRSAVFGPRFSSEALVTLVSI